jgi:hypothetical protein
MDHLYEEKGCFMSEWTGKIWLEKLRRRWVITNMLRGVLYAVGVAIITAALLSSWYNLAIVGSFISFIISLVALFLLNKYWRLSLEQISSFVDGKYPEVENSSSLLLADTNALSALQKLQSQRVNEVLVQQKLPKEPWYQLRMPLIFLAASVLFFFILPKLRSQEMSDRKPVVSVLQKPASVQEVVPATISGYRVSITPPAYTRKTTRQQEQFTLLVEHGSTVNWKLQTSEPISELRFVWNDKESHTLRKTDGTGRSWSFSKVLTRPGFYQVMLDGKKSDFYQVEIIPDQPVAIKILSPEQHSTIDFGEPQRVDLKVLMTDDYGISTAIIHATTARGKGEAVSFKEHKINLNTQINNQKSINLRQQLSLAGLGMKAGDELYFFVNATDNHGQQSRSDMYFVSIQDTAALMSMAGIDNGVNLVPEYFRSQRQIIIDTEKLLRERSTISDADFKKRSNELGIDQKMLRLRYGKFLGEEEETNIGGNGKDHEGHGADDGHGHEAHEEKPAYGDVQGLMDQYAHKHDQAEDATFFEPQMKAQLKATLNEMWSAELQLRTYDPQKALPFEYKALRLLKDLQQKSRAYVAKTVVKTTPLKAEKRLSGELNEIQEAAAVNKNAGSKDQTADLRASLSLLELRKSGAPGKATDLQVLRTTEQALVDAAAAAPGKYLPALKAMKTLTRMWTAKSDIGSEAAIAERGINSLLGASQPRPYKSIGSPKDITKAYFNQLNRTNR